MPLCEAKPFGQRTSLADTPPSINDDQSGSLLKRTQRSQFLLSIDEGRRHAPQCIRLIIRIKDYPF